MGNKLTRMFVEKVESGKEIGNSDDVRCRQSNFKLIGISDCKNNCKYNKYDTKKQKKVCSLGYR